MLIDTAGRYTTQDSHKVVDSSAWQNFLNLLKKHRPRRPINGALIAISVQDLLTQQPGQRSHSAKLIRERIDELQKTFGVRFPIYVMLTKADLIAGFTEFFANLTQPERQQVWGVTFEPQQAQASLSGLGQEFDQLIRSLNDRVLWRVHNERDPAKRALIQAFPQQVENLKPLAEEFMNEAFAPSRYTEQPLLRGVYLCSGTQEGTPIDRMMAAVSSNFGLSRDALRNQSGTGKSFFINRLFRDIVIPEAEVVGSNRKLETSLRWLRRGYFGLLGVVFVALLGVWFGTLNRNNSYMEQVTRLTGQYRQADAKLGKFDQNPVSTLPALNPLRKASNVYDQQEHPWLASVGLYDSSVDQAANRLYLDALRKDFLPRFQYSLEQQLRSLAATDDGLINTFRVYLMLADKAHFNADTLRNWAKTEWEKRLPGEAGKQQDLLNHLNTLLQQGLGPVKLDQQLIASVRLKLKQIPAPQRLYSQLKSSNLGKSQLDLYGQIGGQGAAMFGLADNASQSKMSGLFSKDGYKSLDFSTDSPLLKQLENDRWIFGNTKADDFSDADKEALAKQLKTQYLNEYASRWNDFLNALHIQDFGDLAQTTAALKKLADPAYSPIVAVLRVTRENTALTPGWPAPPTLPGATGKAAGAASILLKKAVKPTSVDVTFLKLNQLTANNAQQPPPLNDILSGIKALHDYLNNMAVDPNPNAAIFNAAKARYNGNSADALHTLRALASNAPAPVNTWLNEIADHTWSVMLKRTKAYLDSAWHQQAYEVYTRTLANRYPMRTVTAEATVDDFNQFFSPAGVEAKFVQANVKPFLDNDGRAKPLEHQAVAFSPTSLEALRAADAIRTAFYRDNPASPGYHFKLTPAGLDTAVGKFELQLGNQRNVYTHGPRIPKRYSWQISRDTQVRILFEDLNQTLHRARYSGPWAWLRALDDAHIRKIGNTRYRAVFQKDGRKATYLLDTSSRISGLDVPLLRHYHCPKNL